MQADAFGDLASALCARLGIEEPTIESRAGELDTVHLAVDDFRVWFLHAPVAHEHLVSIVVECGRMPGEHRELQAWLDLLDANFHPDGACAPRYCRDPVSGSVMLQIACDVCGLSAASLHSKVEDMLRLAREWRVRCPKGQS